MIYYIYFGKIYLHKPKSGIRRWIKEGDIESHGSYTHYGDDDLYRVWDYGFPLFVVDL